jgi:hypothetical protein
MKAASIQMRTYLMSDARHRSERPSEFVNAENLCTSKVNCNGAPGGTQIASGTIMIAPQGHSWAHSPQPLQKS